MTFSLPAAPLPTLSTQAHDLELWLTQAALPLWWERGADHANGGFHEALGAAGDPVALPRRLHVQARQVYVYANAGKFGWDGPWRDAVTHGIDYLRRYYIKPDGLARATVDPMGRPVDDRPLLYGQAFTLLALASAYEVFPHEPQFKLAAIKLLERLDATRRTPQGGYLEITDQPFQANANMHMLEAMLAWIPLCENPIWTQAADRIAELALSHFIDGLGGILREFFSENWSPKPGDDGRLVEPGHQFEWMWLLERWSRVRGRPEGLAPLAGLFAAGQRGIDPKRGVAINALWDDLTVRDANARLWPQTERIKAALTMARLRSESEQDRYADAVRAATGLQAYLATPLKGLWWDKWQSGGAFVEEPSPASSFYHIVCAILELKADTAAPSTRQTSSPIDPMG